MGRGLTLDPPDPPLLVTMGVSGSGKSTVGRTIADRLGLPYADADEFHPPSNVAKMAAGTPLADEDRWPWLEAIGAWLAWHERDGAVASCSALRRAYRDVLRAKAPSVTFVHLVVERAALVQRVAHRPGHFMPSSLLGSQLATLEPPAPDEPTITVGPEPTPAAAAEKVLRRLGGGSQRADS